jgi:two-component system sensor histidine kinase UhpB
VRDLPSIVIEMIEARDEESSRIGSVLHDEIGQLLTAAGLHLDAARQSRSAEEQRRQLDEAQRVFERAIEVVRELSQSLPPSMVQRVGLSFALERLVARYRGDNEQRIRLLHDTRARLDARTGQAMFRIAECALDNAVRHAGAALIEVLLRRTAKGILLEVRDQGQGFDVAAEKSEPSGLGLLLMEQSARRAGLSFAIQSRPGTGTTVSVLATAPGGEATGEDATNADRHC